MTSVSHSAYRVIPLLFFPLVHVQAQWPTSTRTDSSLHINYGISGRMITFDDGSSIISHGVENTVFVQKFDPEGYRVWPDIVVAHDNDSSDFLGGSRIVSDGSGGAVLLWEDYRGAIWDSINSQYINEAFYMQRVDRDGNVAWQEGGVLVVPPDSGTKAGRVASDGTGGAIVVAVEGGFNYPGAPNRERLFAARVGPNGTKLWDVTLESSTNGGDLNLYDVDRAGRFVYVDYGDSRYPPLGQHFTWIVDTAGVAGPPPWVGSFTNVAWRDSVLFSIGGDPPILEKIDPVGNVLWNSPIDQDTCLSITGFLMNFLVPDGVGGCYLLCVDEDSLLRVNSSGIVSRFVFPGIGDLGGHAFGDGVGGLVAANDDGLAQRYDSLGIPLWGSSPITYQSDPENSYFEDYWGDNNGGIISTFWAISSSLSAQHTGRYGEPGIVVTSVSDDDKNIPQRAFLAQNFPNPFNPVTTIRYSVPFRSHTRVKIVDLLGQDVVTIVDELKEVGNHVARWDATAFSSGVYFYRLELDGVTVKTMKMVFLR